MEVVLFCYLSAVYKCIHVLNNAKDVQSRQLEATSKSQALVLVGALIPWCLLEK